MGDHKHAVTHIIEYFMVDYHVQLFLLFGIIFFILCWFSTFMIIYTLSSYGCYGCNDPSPPGLNFFILFCICCKRCCFIFNIGNFILCIIYSQWYVIICDVYNIVCICCRCYISSRCYVSRCCRNRRNRCHSCNCSSISCCSRCSWRLCILNLCCCTC